MSTAGVIAPRNGPLLQRWDPRLRIIGLLILAFSFSTVSEPRAIPAMFGLTIFFWAISGVPARYVLHRLRYPSLLIILLVVVLPFAGGTTPLFEIGRLTVTREGLHSAVLIAARFSAILALATVFFSAAPVLVNIRAVQALGLPYIMADMALLVVRYIEAIGQDLRRMRRSMQLRGHQGGAFSWKTIQTTAWLVGSLMLRSYERAERVYTAMRLRGYGRTDGRPTEFSASMGDGLALAAVAGAACWLAWPG